MYLDFSNESFTKNNGVKRRGVNPIKSSRKDVLEEIFGDDLFASISNRVHTPANSKTKPQISKKSNKYDDFFRQIQTLVRMGLLVIIVITIREKTRTILD